jgi:hypothetical protein
MEWDNGVIENRNDAIGRVGHSDIRRKRAIWEVPLASAESKPEILLYQALKSLGVSFAPLPVFVRGAQQNDYASARGCTCGTNQIQRMRHPRKGDCG